MRRTRKIVGKFIFKALNLNLLDIFYTLLLFVLISVFFPLVFGSVCHVADVVVHFLISSSRQQKKISINSELNFLLSSFPSSSPFLLEDDLIPSKERTNPIHFPPIYFSSSLNERVQSQCVHIHSSTSFYFQQSTHFHLNICSITHRANNKNFLTSLKKSQKFAYNQVDCHKSSFFFIIISFFGRREANSSGMGGEVYIVQSKHDDGWRKSEEGAKGKRK